VKHILGNTSYIISKNLSINYLVIVFITLIIM